MPGDDTCQSLKTGKGIKGKIIFGKIEGKLLLGCHNQVNDHDGVQSQPTFEQGTGGFDIPDFQTGLYFLGDDALQYRDNLTVAG